MSDILLEVIRAAILLYVVFYLIKAGNVRKELCRKGWGFVIAGFGFLLFANIMDITDNFESLNRFIVIGDTPAQAFLEKMVGFMGGFGLLAIGLVRWIPSITGVENQKQTNKKLENEITERKKTEKKLRDSIEDIKQAKTEADESTQRAKQAESLVKKERDFAEGIVNTAQAVILVLDTEGRIVRFNPYMEELTGYRAEEVKGKDWFSCFLPERNHERIRELFLQAIDDIQTCGNVNPVVTKDGREREIEWFDKTIKDVEGNTIGLLAIGQDVTERIDNEKKLQKSFAEIERFNKLMTGREGRVIEMKRQVNALLAELGRQPQYQSVLEDETVVSSDKTG